MRYVINETFYTVIYELYDFFMRVYLPVWSPSRHCGRRLRLPRRPAPAWPNAVPAPGHARFPLRRSHLKTAPMPPETRSPGPPAVALRPTLPRTPCSGSKAGWVPRLSYAVPSPTGYVTTQLHLRFTIFINRHMDVKTNLLSFSYENFLRS